MERAPVHADQILSGCVNTHTKLQNNFRPSLYQEERSSDNYTLVVYDPGTRASRCMHKVRINNVYIRMRIILVATRILSTVGKYDNGKFLRDHQLTYVRA